jgi:hypothetical protein
MPYLSFRLPAQVYLAEPYRLTDRILLQPAQRVQLERGGATFFLSSFFYIESDPPADTSFPPECPFAPSYENLRDFIVFWSFLQDNDWAIRAFERAESAPVFGETPFEEPSEWNNGIQVLDPNKMRIRSGNDFSVSTYELKDLYRRFIEAGQDFRDLIALERYEPNRYSIDSRRQAYDNHLMRSAFDWVIVDALSPAERCGGPTTCPKCGGTAKSSHVTRTFEKRMKEDLLKNFPDACHYAKVLSKYKDCRANFFHSGRREDMPVTAYPTRDLATREARRSVSLGETLQNFRNEGLATMNAGILLHEIVHCILLNRLIPDLALWPRFSPLQMVSFGG